MIMHLLLPLFSLLILSHSMSQALPLSTHSRWIVDEHRQRVKLACVNWVSHLDSVVTEGLSKQPIDVIIKKIKGMGFNCVRLTWPIYLVTNDSLASLTVRQSFLNFGLTNDILGIQANNPSFLDLSLIKVFQAVVTSLSDNKVMVILDNHLTKPGWCCSRTDGNGFFGDKYFEPNFWIHGLRKMATLFKDNPNVIGMSLRNELRGPRQNVNDWYRYMQKGAEAVHRANPNVLVILSGFNFDKDLSFLHNKPVTLSFKDKLVFEVHWYAFSDRSAWKYGDPKQVCHQVVQNYTRMVGFLPKQGYPLFVSEWGVDLRGTDANDNKYLDCFLKWVSKHDFDWALWTLVGSYYFREGVVGMEEYYGILDYDWVRVRNSKFLDKISAIQSPRHGNYYFRHFTYDNATSLIA
ncbi:glycosyl hydrolase 5 family protein-like [Silene latifolia]|uniref:glycosyl hydrolase 5 family protein-like n=1 Tax=Silene latifolia TaxID=37657 RepID=UPI003D77C8AF